MRCVPLPKTGTSFLFPTTLCGCLRPLQGQLLYEYVRVCTSMCVYVRECACMYENVRVCVPVCLIRVPVCLIVPDMYMCASVPDMFMCASVPDMYMCARVSYTYLQLHTIPDFPTH